MTDVRKVARLLGGKTVLGRRVRSAIDLHEVMERGLSREALGHFVDRRRWLSKTEVLRFVGVMETGKSRLKRGQSDRLFTLAEALAAATDAFKSTRRAERWLTIPLTSAEIGPRRPIDLLTTPVGERMVAETIAEAALMDRIERAAERGIKDIAEGRYTVLLNRDDSRKFIERISHRVARKHRAKANRPPKKT